MQQQETNKNEIKKQEIDKCIEICYTLKILLWVAIILIGGCCISKDSPAYHCNECGNEYGKYEV